MAGLQFFLVPVLLVINPDSWKNIKKPTETEQSLKEGNTLPETNMAPENGWLED